VQQFWLGVTTSGTQKDENTDFHCFSAHHKCLSTFLGRNEKPKVPTICPRPASRTRKSEKFRYFPTLVQQFWLGVTTSGTQKDENTDFHCFSAHHKCLSTFLGRNEKPKVPTICPRPASRTRKSTFIQFGPFDAQLSHFAYFGVGPSIRTFWSPNIKMRPYQVFFDVPFWGEKTKK
jgi:hypothetical protein